MSQTPDRGTDSSAGAAARALKVLRDAQEAIGTSGIGVRQVPAAIEEIMASAREVYARACMPANTALIADAVERVLHDPAAREDPEIWAFYANVRCCDYLNRWNDSNADTLAAAEQALQTALRLDPDHRRAVYVSGFVHRARGRDADSLAAFERVIGLRPDAGDRMLAEAYAQSGAQWMYLGHPERTRALVDKAIAIVPPDSPAVGVFYWIAARPPFLTGNYRDAIELLERSVAIRGNFWYTRAWLIAAYALAGKHEAAQRGLALFRQMFPQLQSVAAIVAAQRSPHEHLVMISALQKLQEGLMRAELPTGDSA